MLNKILNNKGEVTFKIFLIVVAVAVIVGILLFAMPKGSPESKQLKNTYVVAALADIPANTPITHGMLTRKNITLSEPGAIKAEDMVTIDNNYVTAVAIPKGDQVTRSMIIPIAQAPANARLLPSQAAYIIRTDAPLTKGTQATVTYKGKNMPVTVADIKDGEATLFFDKKFAYDIIEAAITNKLEIK
ncbi:hypothetical protein AAIR98_000741 [Elusimicrobium simillimum]|uniref:SAF domain-containing protein n=1 Tax=Elusimicrobium simillimum TaxID=3143438 RepID=UPI003C6F7CC1